MFARCARVEPAMALRPYTPSCAWTSSVLSCCTTVMPCLSARLSEPLAPFTVILSAAMVALTPCGRSTGFFATRDMALTLAFLLDDEQHFAAGVGGAGLLVGHDALRRRDDRHPEATQYLRQLVLAPVDAQPRPADALDAVDHGASLV